MDPEQTFLRVHTRLSGVLARLFSPKLRSGLEFVCLCNAVMLLGLLVVMHVNFVAQISSSSRVVIDPHEAQISGAHGNVFHEAQTV